MAQHEAARTNIALTTAAGLALALAATRGLAQGEPFPATATIDELTVFGSGFRMLPDAPGRAIAGVGDLNGDGIDDVAFGVDGADPDGLRGAGRVYVVFGRDASLPTEIDLDALSGTNGFRLDGALARDALGASVAPAGDLNGDGIGDMIVGAKRIGDYAPEEPGRCYVVFGRRGAFPPVLRTDELDGDNGFRFEGHAAEGERHVGTGGSVAGVGDVNGDGVDDVAVGAPGAWVGGQSYVGKAHVLFGRRDGFPAMVSAADLDGSNGFTIPGLAQEDFFGQAGSGAGDFNGDGVGDMAFASARAGNAGEVYVVFGRASGFPAEFDLGTLDGSTGLTIGNGSGSLGRAALGLSVALGGDVNGDGIDDLVAGAPVAGPMGVYGLHAGKSFVVYGRSDGFAARLDVATLDGADGFRIDGDRPEDGSGGAVAIVGDVNGDGFEDVVVGADYRGAELCGYYLCRTDGAAYIVFGGDDIAAQISLADVDGERIVRIDGSDGWPGGGLGVDVAPAGDVNDDGVSDIAVRGGQNAYVVYGRGLVCPADLDGDGELTLFDFLAFQNLFDAGDPVADFDGDGELTIFDFLAFQNAFDAGCP
jgi:glycosylphosphatidylinositol phospholipase D